MRVPEDFPDRLQNHFNPVLRILLRVHDRLVSGTGAGNLRSQHGETRLRSDAPVWTPHRLGSCAEDSAPSAALSQSQRAGGGQR